VVAGSKVAVGFEAAMRFEVAVVEVVAVEVAGVKVAAGSR